MKNKLILWEPCRGISKQFLFLQEWRWDGNGVTIILADDKNKYVVRFKNHVCSFRSSSEYYMWMARNRHRIWSEENMKIRSWPFFIVKNSDYKEWFRCENENLYPNEIDSLVHYVIYTDDEIIDILNDTPPEVIIKKL